VNVKMERRVLAAIARAAGPVAHGENRSHRVHRVSAEINPLHPVPDPGSFMTRRD